MFICTRPLVQYWQSDMIEPKLIPVSSLKPETLCVGVKRGDETVIYYNKNREISDLPRQISTSS